MIGDEMLKRSLRPMARPSDFAVKVRAVKKQAGVVSGGETPASVSGLATYEAVLTAAEPMVLGVFGKEAAPQALVRLPDGSVTQVRVGSRLGSQQVIGVMEDCVILTNSQRLTMPH